MENFSNWQIVLLAALLLFVLFLLVRFFARARARSSRQLPPLQDRKISYYEDLTGYLNRYTDLVELLAREFRYAFNHADQLTPESEEAAEEIITELEKIETEVRERTNLLVLINEKELAEKINDFLLKDRNKRHASPRDLEEFTTHAREKAAHLIGLMQKNLGIKTGNEPEKGT